MLTSLPFSRAKAAIRYTIRRRPLIPQDSSIAMKALCIGAALALLVPCAQAAADDELWPTVDIHAEFPAPKRADFAAEQASRDARQLADWIVDAGDNQGRSFVIIDKTNARLFVFDSGGVIRGAASVLLGSARGDHTVPGIGKKPLSAIRPEERTTPAGRFVAAVGRNFRGEDVVWVDYDSAVSMHPVIRTKDRLQRMASATTKDKRISYGCINVPAAFYASVVLPAFTGTESIVYVLPEVRSMSEVFGSYDVDERFATARSQPK
jgi:hypothetical protein